MSGRWAVYVHIPFCVRRCTYCDFPVAVGMSGEDRRRYVDAVLAEWASESLPSGPIGSVYFGGGTPSLAEPQDIGRVLEAIAGRRRLIPGAEVTLEANPGTVTRERLASYRAAGVNRLSLGVQAAQTHHLAALHREHSVEAAHTAIRWARRVGIDNVSVDAIYGIPDQTLAEWRDTLRTLVSWEPDHLSLYGLQLEERTPLWRSVHRGETVLPSEDLVGDMGDWAETRLPAWGYARYEVSNFARPGFESRHNRAYWRHRPYVGLGAGAHSFSGAGRSGATRWWNGPNVRRYVEDALAGRDVAAGCEQVDAAALAGEFVWLGLRETAGVSLAHFAETFGVTLSAAFPGVVDPLVRQHLLVQDGGRLYLTRRGLSVSNQVFHHFLRSAVSAPAADPLTG